MASTPSKPPYIEVDPRDWPVKEVRSINGDVKGLWVAEVFEGDKRVFVVVMASFRRGCACGVRTERPSSIRLQAWRDWDHGGKVHLSGPAGAVRAGKESQPRGSRMKHCLRCGHKWKSKVQNPVRCAS